MSRLPEDATQFLEQWSFVYFLRARISRDTRDDILILGGEMDAKLFADGNIFMRCFAGFDTHHDQAWFIRHMVRPLRRRNIGTERAVACHQTHIGHKLYRSFIAPGEIHKKCGGMIECNPFYEEEKGFGEG